MDVSTVCIGFAFDIYYMHLDSLPHFCICQTLPRDSVASKLNILSTSVCDSLALLSSSALYHSNTPTLDIDIIVCNARVCSSYSHRHTSRTFTLSDECISVNARLDMHHVCV